MNGPLSGVSFLARQFLISRSVTVSTQTWTGRPQALGNSAPRHCEHGAQKSGRAFRKSRIPGEKGPEEQARRPSERATRRRH